MTPTLAVLALAGEFDLSEWDELGRHLRMLETAKARGVEVRVHGVSFIDVACLRMLDQLRLRLAARGRPMALVGATPRLHRIARLAGYPELVA